MSSSRRIPYFFNPQTKDSRWDPPEGFSDQQIQQLPGAEYLFRPTEPEKVRASHLLVKHRGSRRPSSWKEVRVQQLFFSLVTSRS